MAKRERPDMGENLGGFDGLYSGANPPIDSPKSGNQNDAPAPAPESTPPAPGRPRKAATPSERTNAPARPERTVEPPPKAAWGAGKTRNTRSFSITDNVYDRLRRAAYAKGVTLSELVEVALTRSMDRAEEANGGEFPEVPQKARGRLDDL